MTQLFKRVVSFDLKTYASLKYDIFSKYEKFEDLDVTVISQKKFVKQLDKYLLHTIEEIEEAMSSFDLDTISDDFIEELADILSYTGTTYSFIKKNLIKHYDNEIVKNVCSDELLINSDILSTFNMDDLYRSLLSIMSNTINCRKLFPERKWHKPIPKVDDKMIEERLCSIIKYLENVIVVCLSLIINASELNHTDYNEIIMDKHRLIMQLPLV